MPASVETGRLVYETRCVSCHGKSGSGDGPLAAIIKNPRPFILKLSRLSADALEQIITEGGAAVKRSPAMPPWGAELTATHFDSVKLDLVELRGR